MLGQFLAVVLAVNATGEDLSESAKKMLFDRKASVRAKAAEEVGKSQVNADQLIPLLLQALHDESPDVVAKAIKGLGNMRAKEAVPALRRLRDVKGTTRPVKLAAEKAMERIGPLSEDEEEWLLLRNRFIIVGGKFFKIPEFDLNYPNSNKLTPLEARKKLPPQSSVDERWINACYPLPGTSVGDFGIVTEWKTIQVTDDGILVRGLCGRDDDSMVKAMLFEFGNLVDGKWYDLGAMGVAIVATTTYQTVAGGSNTVPVAIPLDVVRRGINFKEYGVMIEKHASPSKVPAYKPR